MQPYFFPYLGHFALIASTDQWVVFDVTQYTPRSWMNRNRVLHPQRGWIYVNAPLAQSSISLRTREARLNILGQMNQVLAQSRAEVNANAPTYATIQISTDKIRDVIGKGGAMIRSICEQTKASIDIDDSGLVRIYGETKGATQAALARVQEVTAEVEVGAVYEGTVARIVDFGAFINILPGTDGLVHISQIAHERVENVTDHLKEGQVVKVKVLDVDQRGRIKLSMKELIES